ncbi:MAG: methyl-accepting chemotaxis protein [Betaproteobacteria bacterium]|nr:methyl-accepting chemotaxis protein [Betaproteobacteria bacterium]
MLGKLTIRRRLAYGFGFFFAMLAVSGLLGLNRLSSLDSTLDRIVTVDWNKTVLANEAMDLMNANARETFLLFLTDDRAPVKERIGKNVLAITERLDKLEKLLYRPEGQSLLAEVKSRRSEYVASFHEVSRLLDAGQTAEASRRMSSETVPRLAALLGSVTRLIEFQGTILEQSGRQSHETYTTARNVISLFLAIGGIAAVLLAVSIIRSVMRPLGGEPDEAKAVVQRIAGGDLTHEIVLQPGDRTSLLAAMRDMQTSLRNMISELKSNSDSVSGAAQQLSAAAVQLAAGTARQSESASSMASAVEEMTVSITHVAESADVARQATNETGLQSSSGRQVIGNTVEEMGKISEAVEAASAIIHDVGDESQKISGIVQVIKDVAEQTNLLALNAAIEAARAGETGRGFAVVADEVRKLSERTAAATTEIAAMILSAQNRAQAAVTTMQGVVTRVSSGVALAHRAGESMSAIGDSAEKLVGTVNEISRALKEQSVASNDIAGNIERVAQMSEENSAATRAAAETAHRLEKLAVEAHEAVSRFSL